MMGAKRNENGKTMHRVNGETLAQTTECRHDFLCLGGCCWEVCPAERSLGEDGVLLALCRRPWCPYLEASPDLNVCTCPTRKELHERHGV